MHILHIDACIHMPVHTGIQLCVNVRALTVHADEQEDGKACSDALRVCVCVCVCVGGWVGGWVGG